MVRLIHSKVILNADGSLTEVQGAAGTGREKTMTWRILNAHNESGNMEQLRIRFDAMVSPDNNYVNILQTARASGMQKFPVPYVLSNCHNTLCAVGGTILEDDHVFGLSNVKKYGGIFVPPYRAVLHQYMREMMAGGGTEGRFPEPGRRQDRKASAHRKRERCAGYSGLRQAGSHHS